MPARRDSSSSSMPVLFGAAVPSMLTNMTQVTCVGDDMCCKKVILVCNSFFQSASAFLQ